MRYKNEYGVDGIMIGRASIGNPWIFREIKHFFRTGEILHPPTIEEKVGAAREHLKRSLEWKGEKLGVLEMRRHYSNYFRGLPQIKSYRSILVTEHSPELLFATLDEIADRYSDSIVLA